MRYNNPDQWVTQTLELGFTSIPEALETLYAEHGSLAKVAELYDRGETTIKTRMKHYNIPIRPKGGRKKGFRYE